MESALNKIEYNLKANFEVLSDFAFLKDDIFYLSSPFLGPSSAKYKPKYLRADQDGVCEMEGTPQLSFLHFKEIAGQNKKLKENFEYLTGEVFDKPVEAQEEELARLLRECDVNLKQFVYAGQIAARKFRPVKNLYEFSNIMQRKLSYSLEVCSGVFGEAIIENEGVYKVYQGPLRILWENMGLTPKQIGGSKAYFDKNGMLSRITLELEHRKRKPAPDYLQFIIGFTDNLKGDFPMMDVNINMLPIALVFGGLPEIPRGLATACPEARKDMKMATNSILKIERGIMEEIGNVDIQRAEKIGVEIKKLFDVCLKDEASFLSNRETYVDRCFEFLDILTISANQKYPLFPEKLTGIRDCLNRLKNTSDVANGIELTEKTVDILKRYSAEFPR